MKKYLVLFAGILLISGCETLGGGGSSDAPSYEYGDSKQANLQAYLQNEIGDRVYFETDKYNINSASAYVLESQANWLKSCLLYTSPSPRDGLLSRMPSSA